MALYREASRILQCVVDKKGSTRSLIFSSSLQNKKALFALVCESLKYLDFLTKIYNDIKILSLEKSLHSDRYLAVVLLYDHIVGRGICGKYKAIVQKYKSAIHSKCERMKIQAGVSDIKHFSSQKSSSNVVLPRYVRVNTLKTTTANVTAEFSTQGWTATQATISSVLSEKKKFITDPDVPDLLVFPPNTDFHDNNLFLSGQIILQDKASCFPAFLLSPPSGSHVIDCCAAPGNKTTHLASIMDNKGTVFAFDMDSGRLTTLQQMTKKAGASCVIAKCKDFLSVKPDDRQYKDVQYVLVDPSCSGTGIVNRVQEHSEEVSEHRLQQLSKFQITILKHALCFPAVSKVIYSTCSVKEEENEQVVEEVYEQVKDNFVVSNLLPDWPERGIQTYQHGHCCLRLSPQVSFTNGFFVSCFERINKSNGDTQKPPGYHGNCVVMPKCESDKTSACENKLTGPKKKNRKRKKKSVAKENSCENSFSDIKKIKIGCHGDGDKEEVKSIHQDIEQHSSATKKSKSQKKRLKKKNLQKQQ